MANTTGYTAHTLVPLTLANTEKLARVALRMASKVVDEEVEIPEAEGTGDGRALQKVVGQVAILIMETHLANALQYGVDEAELEAYLAQPKGQAE